MSRKRDASKSFPNSAPTRGGKGSAASPAEDSSTYGELGPAIQRSLFSFPPLGAPNSSSAPSTWLQLGEGAVVIGANPNGRQMVDTHHIAVFRVQSSRGSEPRCI